MHRKGIEELIGKVDALERLQLGQGSAPFHLFGAEFRQPRLLLPAPVRRRLDDHVSHGREARRLPEETEHVMREISAMRPLLHDGESRGSPEPFPHLGKLPRQQPPKERPDAHIGDEISSPPDGRPPRGVVPVLRVKERRLHEIVEGNGASGRDPVAEEPGQGIHLAVACIPVSWDVNFRQMTSWEDYLPPRKPFYRRPWFITLVVLVVLIGGGSALVVSVELARWEHKAQTFDYTKVSEMESASIIYDRNSQVLGRIFIQNRDEVPIDELSPNLLKAVVGAEDARFYQHHGVDYYGILRAMIGEHPLRAHAPGREHAHPAARAQYLSG